MHRTPTVNLNAYSSSDSNQSPPSSSFKIDTEVQTDYSSAFDSEYSLIGSSALRLQEDNKKIKDELLRLNTDLKQKYERELKKVQASRETIKTLLIQKSRMERKQVNF